MILGDNEGRCIFIFNVTIETIYKFYILERDGFSLPAISIDCKICKVLGCDAIPWAKYLVMSQKKHEKRKPWDQKNDTWQVQRLKGVNLQGGPLPLINGVITYTNGRK